MLFLFDIDGTLVSGDGAGRRSFDRACREVLGVGGDDWGALDEIKLDGMTDPLILAHVFERHLGRAGRPEEYPPVLERYLALLGPELERSRPLQVHEGVFALLDRLAARGARLGLATGNLRDGARIKLEAASRALPAATALWPRFAFGGFGSDAADRAELVRVGIARGRALATTAISDAEVWVIGDTPRDIAAAHAAGALAVGVATGSFDVAQLQAAGADVVVPTLAHWTI